MPTARFQSDEVLPVGVLCSPFAIMLIRTAFESPLRAAPQARYSGGSSGPLQGGLLRGWGLRFGTLGSPVTASVWPSFPGQRSSAVPGREHASGGRRGEAAAQKMPPTPSRGASSWWQGSFIRLVRPLNFPIVSSLLEKQSQNLRKCSSHFVLVFQVVFLRYLSLCCLLSPRP